MSLFAETLLLTLKLSALATALLLAIGVPLAYWLAHTPSRTKPLVETLVSMPMVLPPSVIGFYLLVAFNPEDVFGKWLDSVLHLRLVFTFEGLVVASVLYSLPFMVRPVQAGFESLPSSLREASYTLGKSRVQTLWRVLLPNMKPALLTGGILSFAHTIGEFGIVLMIGGNIPGTTRVASIAIYDEVESLHYGMANRYSLVLLSITFVILLAVSLINKKQVRSI
jgi:molybdate transport system permease protein